VELNAKIEAIKNRGEARKDVDTKKREEELKFLKLQEGHLTKFHTLIKESTNKQQQ
jgi:hypothetical protein